MSWTLVRMRRPIARMADGVLYRRDRRRRIRQFHRVTRVTLRN
jgi:hypothetical protein